MLQISDLRRCQISCRAAVQQKIEPGSFLEFLDRVDGRLERNAGHDRSMIGKKHGGMPRGDFAHGFRQCPVAGRIVWDRGKFADTHHIVGATAPASASRTYSIYSPSEALISILNYRDPVRPRLSLVKRCTVCSMAPNTEFPASSFISIRTVSPNFKKGVCGTPELMVSITRSSAMQE